ncbi:uncharacterized protein LOC135396642 isoform X2 [Ornithodoros turicata]|uniref:uncharacterized protein LOC135396642 isoform X2 n=1 Tax=Ornithodoros turicata TaxID=34597 RepID=UPI003139A591
MIGFRDQMLRGRFPQDVSLSSLVYERLQQTGGAALVEDCCDACHTHVSQLRQRAVAMLQSFEPPPAQLPFRTASPVPPPKPPLKLSPAWRAQSGHIRQRYAARFNNNRITPASPETTFTGLRVPSPMPPSLPGCDRRMSAEDGTSSPAKRPVDHDGETGVRPVGLVRGGPVAQQAQEYLEQNIRYLMRPRVATTALSQASGGAPTGMFPGSARGGCVAPLDPAMPPFAPAPASSTPCTPLMSTSPSSCPLAASTSFPHSLDAAGHSSSGVLQGTSYSSPCGSAALVGRSPSAAASFFARAAQRLNLSSKKKRRHTPAGGMGSTTESDSQLVTHFSDIIRDSPPPAPPTLLRGIGRKDTGLGKVKVMLRVCPASTTASSAPGDGRSFLSLDARKKQVTLYDPSASTSSSPETPNATAARLGVAAPKMFAFDAIFSQDDTQTEVCSTSLTDIIQAVVNGSDGCLFVYGHAHLGKTWTMLGGSGSSQELGVIPCAISWLFRLINEHKQKTGARFSVRASAVHISGRSETLRDLLADHATGTEGSSPGVYLRDDPVFGTKLMNYSELRAPTAERAAFLLDAAVTAASANHRTEEDRRNSHFLFTLHVYQYRVDKSGRGGVAGGRSRLHLFDLGSCEKTAKGPLTLSALGNVILALFNAQKRVPHKDSKVTQLLKEALGSVTCRAAMVAHVSPSSAHYAETLATIQLASRVHRIRRKKIKYVSTGSGADVCDGAVCRPFMRTQAVNEDGGVKSGSSDPEYTSSSEQSCDTVIYVGRHQDFTDNEGPPCIPSVSQTAPTPQNSPARTSTVTKPQEPLAKNSSALATATRTPSPDVKLKTAPGGSATKSTLPRHATAGRSPHHQPSSPDCQQRTHSLKKMQHKSPAKDVTAEGAKKQSDEVWVDGPRFSKPRFDTRTLHHLQKEQWVDGPAANVVYGYMDDHKKTMIERWVEEHSRHFQGGKTKKSKNKPTKSHGKETQDGGGSSARSTPEHRKARAHRESEVQQRMSPDRTNRPDDVKADAQSSTGEKASEDDEDRRTEAMEEDDSVQMQDSCLQVTEEDILAATGGWTSNNENPLPEVDQGSTASNGGSSSGRHPLRVLSEEGLNLPSSFTESRSISVDFEEDATNVREEFLGQVYGGLTWRLLQGTLLQRRKERQERRRRLHGEDLNAVIKGDILTEKLERIARLRKLTSPYFDNNNERIPSLLVMRSGASSPTLRTQPYASLPNRGSKSTNRQTVSEMLYGGDESSAESSDCADVTSTHSEPADLDVDKYDIQRLNIKPMNGLKLEAFYNRIQKSSAPMVTGSPPKLSEANTLFQSYSDKLDMLAKDFGVFPGSGSQEIQAHVRFPLTNTGKPQLETEAIDRLQKHNSVSDSQLDKTHGATSIDDGCTLASRTDHEGATSSAKSSSENCRDLDGPKLENTQNISSSPAHQPKPRMNKALNSSCRASPTHPKSEHSSPKRMVSSPKPGHKAANGHTAKSHAVVAQHGGSPASSSCGALTTCCSPTRSKSAGKAARTPCSNGKHCNGEKSRKYPRNPPTNVQCNPLCRSVSTPTTPCCAADMKSDMIQQAETLESDLLPSPYSKVTQARPTVRESSSGHGSSDSSSFKGTMKTIQVVQCSGTSSGYESIILRDSTAPSSSQDSGSERGLKELRGRKGSRKNGQGSGRSRSAPGRSPPQSPPVQRRQPMPGFGQHVHRWRHAQELRAHQPEDEVGCAGLLCCRLLDFY